MAETHHQREILSRPLLVEALLELRFTSDALSRSYGSIPGQLYERLKAAYPEFEDLDTAQLPYIPEFDHLVRHRYSASDKAGLVQVGRGVLTVNCLQYESYPAFRDQIRAVLTAAWDVFGPPKDGSVRFINKVPVGERPLGEVLRWADVVPSDMPTAEVRKVEAQFAAQDALGTLRVTWAMPLDDMPGGLLLDLLVARPLADSPDMDAVLEWVDRAHDAIEETFFGMLTEQFVETLK